MQVMPPTIPQYGLPTNVMLDLIDSKAKEGPAALRKLARYAFSYIGDVTITAGEGVERGSHMDIVLKRIIQHLEAEPTCVETFHNLARVHKNACRQYEERQAARAEDLKPPKAEA